MPGESAKLDVEKMRILGIHPGRRRFSGEGKDHARRVRAVEN
jgi:hypothetical protein